MSDEPRSVETGQESAVPFEVWTDALGVQRYLHGTKVDLKPGALIEAGRASNYGERTSAAFTDWNGHRPEQVQAMKDGLARLAAQGIGAIED